MASFQPALFPRTSPDALTVLGRVEGIDNERAIAMAWRSEQTRRSRRGPMTGVEIFGKDAGEDGFAAPAAGEQN